MCISILQIKLEKYIIVNLKQCHQAAWQLIWAHAGLLLRELGLASSLRILISLIFKGWIKLWGSAAWWGAEEVAAGETCWLQHFVNSVTDQHYPVKVLPTHQERGDGT